MILAELKVVEGLSELHLSSLLSYTNSDSDIAKYTNDLDRFGDKEKLANWMKKNRLIYVLESGQQDLLGIIWFGRKDVPLYFKRQTSKDLGFYGLTFAIRLYEEARGKGLSSPFLQTAFQKYKQTEQFKQTAKKGFWLEVGLNNTTAIKTYTRFGFRNIVEDQQTQKILMILHQEDF